ncbi:hypothetical protein [Mycobacterium servetii]|uniref:Uncharacterized protein n=1 Tax=Mycobacterium servetii TaxID=3237418 RepID=A0ABV4C8K2_9MYCO
MPATPGGRIVALPRRRARPNAPDHAVVLGPDVDTWLKEQVTPGAAAAQTPNC